MACALYEAKKAELDRYFAPIYYVEFEETLPGELFPHVFRNGYYDKSRNKKDALWVFENSPDNPVRVIEKDMRTGAEKIIRQRDASV